MVINKKNVKSRLGEIEFAILQIRERSFYPESLEKGILSERVLKFVLAEIYIQCVSTRKLATTTKNYVELKSAIAR